MIGQLLAGRYRVLEVLGAGGFGQTYITADLHLPGQPQCVLKHLKPASTSPEVLEIARKLFQKEAETLQQLGSHEQIPRLLAFFEEDQEFYLVQEYIVGHTLSSELNTQQKWVESAVHRLLREVLSILEFVHGRGVIHRDIKPDNIMRRDADGKLVLIDFGAIKQVRIQQYPNLGEVTKTIAIGTPGYMPLEQAGGTPRPSSDLYALGMIGIQALTGRHPTELSEDQTTGELQWQHLTTMDSPLAAFLAKMTSSHFRDRYATAHEALQALPPLESGSTAAAWQTAPAQVNPPTAATKVVAPAAEETFNFKPSATVQFPVSAARPDEPVHRRPLGTGGKVLMGSFFLLSGAGLGYLMVRPQLIADSFDSAVTTDRCRLTNPSRISEFMTKVRDTPDRNAPVKSKLAQGEKLLYVSEQSEFVQVEQRDGERGWVFNDQIKSCTALAPTLTITPPPPSTIKKPASPPPQTPTSSPPSDEPSLDTDPSIPPLPTESPSSSSVDPPSPAVPTPSASDLFGVPLGAPLGAPLPTPSSNPPTPRTETVSPLVPSNNVPTPQPSSS